MCVPCQAGQGTEDRLIVGMQMPPPLHSRRWSPILESFILCLHVCLHNSVVVPQV